jgi:predicted transcriptional regulator
VSKARILTVRIIGLLKRRAGRYVKEVARQMDVNRTFLSGYLSALEEHGCVKSGKIGPVKVYFKRRRVKGL